MFQDALEKVNVLTLPRPKNALTRKNWIRSLVISSLNKKLEKEGKY